MSVQEKWLKSYLKCEWPSDETWLMQKENMRLLNYVKIEFFAQKQKCVKKTLKMLHINIPRSSYGEYRKIHSVH